MCFQDIKDLLVTGVRFYTGKEWLKITTVSKDVEMIAGAFRKTTYTDLPHKFEAEHQSIEGGIVLGTAIDYMNSIGFDNTLPYEQEIIRLELKDYKKLKV